MLSDLEFQILDEVYFVSSYQTIFENLSCDEETFIITLTGLLQNGLVIQLKFNSSMKDFEKLEHPDILSLKESSFVASKQGLLIHNSRN